MSEVVAEVPGAAPAAPTAPAAIPASPAEGVQPDAQNPAAPAAAPKGDEKTPVTPDPAEKRGTARFERKIGRLHREAAEQRARADLAERQLAEARPKPTEDPGAPRLENYKDIDEYAKAYAKHESEKALKEHTAKQQSETHKQYQARLLEGWEAKASRADGKYEDFDEVVGELKPTSPWAIAVMEAENGEDIAHYLGSNLKEAQRIASLPPLSQAREIGRLEAKFLAAPPKPKTPSKAPAPVATLTGNSQVASAEYREGMSMPEYMKWRAKTGISGGRRN